MIVVLVAGLFLLWRAIPPYDIDLTELYALCKRDPSAAEARYKNRRVNFVAQISDVDGWPSTTSVELRAPDRKMRDARARLRSVPRPDTALLRAGDVVTLRCLGAVFEDGTPAFRDCVVGPR